MNTNEKGNIGLAKVISDLIEKGYFVFTPFADTTIVDLVVSNKEMELKRIQIKYRKINKTGVLEISSASTINGRKKYSNIEHIDIWAIYCPNNNKVYYLPANIFNNKKTIYLRINKPKNNQKNINLGKDYLSLENIWNE